MTPQPWSATSFPLLSDGQKTPCEGYGRQARRPQELDSSRSGSFEVKGRSEPNPTGPADETQPNAHHQQNVSVLLWMLMRFMVIRFMWFLISLKLLKLIDSWWSFSTSISAILCQRCAFLKWPFLEWPCQWRPCIDNDVSLKLEESL